MATNDLRRLENTLGSVLSLVEKIDVRLQQQESRAREAMVENEASFSSDGRDAKRLPTENGTISEKIDRERSIENDAKASLQDDRVTKSLPILRRPIGSPWPRGYDNSRDLVVKEITASERFADEVLQEFVKDLDNAWVVPEDERVLLAFNKRSLQEGIPDSQQDRLSYGTELKKRIEKICDYNSRLSTSLHFPHVDCGRRFQIFDCYFQGDTLEHKYHTYTVRSDGRSRPFYVQLGRGSGLHQLQTGPRKPPWRRIV